MKLQQVQITPVVELTYINPLLDVMYLKPVVAVTIDERGLNKYARDDVTEIDLATISFGKALISANAEAIDAASFAFGKALTSSNAFTEDEISLSIGFIRDFPESVTASDTVARGVTKPLAHSSQAIDLITSFDITKLLTDIAFAVDQADVNNGDGLEYAFANGQSDLTNTSDTSTWSFGKAIADTPSVTDAISSFDISKALTDAATAGDSAAVDVTKPFTETLTSSDSFDRTFDAVRAFADTSSGADAITAVSVSKALTDAGSSTDAGSLRMTDYADITYFAEDYVGSSRTF